MTGKLSLKSIQEKVAAYYSEKLATHGSTPLGVDWNSQESQQTRFDQLARVIQKTGFFLVNDLGCGYGAFLEYLKSRYHSFSYEGCDISDSMISAAQSKYPTNKGDFKNTYFPSRVADYSIASGVFNVCLDIEKVLWESYVYDYLDILDSHSRYGFAFNCLTSYSDREKMKDYLFYADPCKIFSFCKKKYSRQVALLHDYGLYEFTIIVRKS
ncbi:SAM-dependent methyltransferase [Leptolyngbya valderiana BDU 20041]|nr:SAM-dependent methyltransferase [Leptolyngbya valderiana BDU 20041]